MKSDVAPKTSADANAKIFRASFDNKDYEKKVDGTVAQLNCIATWDNPDKYGDKAEALFGKSYEVETGVRIFNDAGNANLSVKVAEDTFEFTLDKPNY